MRKLMMTLTALLLLATVAMAQGGAEGRAGARGQEKMPFTELDLTAEQQAKIKEIRTETRDKIKAMRSAADAERPSRDAMKQLMEASRKEIEAVLTPEQLAIVKAKQAERRTAWEEVDKDALKADLKQHRQEVKLVIKAARTQLDDFISSEDQASLERLRGVMKTRPKAKKGRGQERQRKPSEEQREQRSADMENWRTENADELAELAALTEKYQEDIKRIYERLKPQMKDWREEKKEILNDYFPYQRAPKAAKKRGANRTGQLGRPSRTGDQTKARKAAAFLLLKG